MRPGHSMQASLGRRLHGPLPISQSLHRLTITTRNSVIFIFEYQYEGIFKSFLNYVNNIETQRSIEKLVIKKRNIEKKIPRPLNNKTLT